MPAQQRPSAARIAAVVGATLPTAQAQGWRVDVGEYPRAIAWGDGAPSWRSRPRRASSRCDARSDGHPIMRRTVHEGAINAIAWQPGQARIATAGEDGAVRILQLGADEPVMVVRPRAERSTSSPGARRATCSRSPRATPACIFGADGKQIERIPAVDSTITGLTWSPDGGAIAVSCYGGVHVIDPKTGARLRHLPGKGSMLSLAWSPDGASSRRGCQDNNVHVWRFPQGKDTVLPGTPLKPRALSWSSDSQLLATTDGPDVMVWNFAGEAPMPPLPVRLVGPPSLTTAVAFGPAAPCWRPATATAWSTSGSRASTTRRSACSRWTGRSRSLAWGPPAGGWTAAARRCDGGRLAGGWVIDQRAAQPDAPARPTQVRRDRRATLPTLYLHKLR